MNIKNVMMMAAMMPAFALAETNSNCASPSPVSASAFPTKWRSPPLSLHRIGAPPFQGKLCIKYRKRGIGNDSNRRRDAKEKLYQLQCTPPAYHAGVEEAHRMP